MKPAKKIDPKKAPLAHRMKPRNLAEFVGQEHIVGKGRLFERVISQDRLNSLILFGPPGTGKSALAHVIKEQTKSSFESLNAVISQVKDIRRAIGEAKNLLESCEQRTILFIDEIHRFNRAQQDALLPATEEGTVILIGTTTHNPYFYIIPPIISRAQIYELYPLKGDDLLKILNNALNDKERGFGEKSVAVEQEAMEHIIEYSGGDARRALNALEIAVLTTAPDEEGIVRVDLDAASDSIQKRPLLYDREDDHYDTISAFIKSMRGTDPDATLYWLAKMIKSGEDPRFIARRILIAASEDVGNANPQTLVVANAALSAVEFIGLPEAAIPLAQAAICVAVSPKSNASYLGIKQAMKDVEEKKGLDVPKHLRDASYRGAKRLGHGAGYKYPHDYPGHYIKQSYLPEKRRYYKPTDLGYERKIKEYLERLRS